MAWNIPEGYNDPADDYDPAEFELSNLAYEVISSGDDTWIED